MTDIADQEPLLSEDATTEEQHDPHQYDDVHHSETDPILDYINSQHHQEEDMMPCRFLGLTALNSLLQYVNWLVWEVCSRN